MCIATAAAGDDLRPASPTNVQVECRGQSGRISIEARNAPLRQVLQAIAECAGLRVNLADGAANERGSWSQHDQSLADALRTILGCHGWVLAGSSTGVPVTNAPVDLEVLACPAAPLPVAETAGRECADCLPTGTVERTAALTQALIDDGPRAARGHILAIEALGPSDAIAPLENGLVAAADPATRNEIVTALARIGSNGALRALAQTALEDGDPGVRRAALEALTDSPRPLARSLIRAALRSDDSGIRGLAAARLAPPSAQQAP